MSPRRVLFVDYYAFVGGGQQNLLNVFAAMDRRRYSPLLAIPQEGAFADAARALKVPVFIVPMAKARWRLWWQAFPAMRRLRALMREQQVDLVHANDFPSLKLAVVAARGLGLPTVYHQQIAVTQKPGSTTGWLMRWHLRHVDKVLAVSQNSLRALEMLGVAPQRLRLIYNNADTVALGRAKPLGAAQLKALGVPPKRPLVLAAGMRRPHKGFDVLLRGLAKYYAGPAAKLPMAKRPYAVLLGDVAHAEAAHEALLQALAQDPVLKGNLSVLPAQRPLAPWLKRATVFVSSSRWEGSPLVVLEAMAAACCVLATHQGAGEVVQDRRDGLLVPSEHPQDLADRLRELMQDDTSLRKRLAAQGRKTTLRSFSLKAYVSSLAGLYDDLLQAHHGL